MRAVLVVVKQVVGRMVGLVLVILNVVVVIVAEEHVRVGQLARETGMRVVVQESVVVTPALEESVQLLQGPVMLVTPGGVGLIQGLMESVAVLTLMNQSVMSTLEVDAHGLMEPARAIQEKKQGDASLRVRHQVLPVIRVRAKFL